jgi:hypothetical protein
MPVSAGNRSPQCERRAVSIGWMMPASYQRATLELQGWATSTVKPARSFCMPSSSSAKIGMFGLALCFFT